MREYFKAVHDGFRALPWKLKRDLFLWMWASFGFFLVLCYICLLFPLLTAAHIAIRLGSCVIYLFVHHIVLPRIILGTHMFKAESDRMQILVDKYDIKKKDS